LEYEEIISDNNDNNDNDNKYEEIMVLIIIFEEVRVLYVSFLKYY